MGEGGSARGEGRRKAGGGGGGGAKNNQKSNCDPFSPKVFFLHPLPPATHRRPPATFYQRLMQVPGIHSESITRD